MQDAVSAVTTHAFAGPRLHSPALTMSTDLRETTFLRDLGGGLILRRAAPADADALATFNAAIHSDDGPEKPDERIAVWTRDLLTRPHPTFHAEDFTIVEESATGRIVSSLNLISQTWAYEGIEFGVGRPELVGTLPEFRGRGLVRLQFEEIHKWSAERGEMAQAITGIPYFYRQFDYEMALDLGGGRIGFEAQLPKLEEGQSEPYRLRPARESDIPFLAEIYAQACRRGAVSCVRDEEIWRYEIGGQSEKNVNRLEQRVIESAEGEPVGYLIHPWYNWSSGLVAMAYELKPQVSWLAVTPGVARYLWETGGAYAKRDEGTRTTYGFWLGMMHPVYDVFRERLPRLRDAYAWYLRVPDVLAFLRRITPALERRLAESIAAGHSGQIRLSFYRGGVRFLLERGRITGVEPWQRSDKEWGDAAFPDLTFLQLLFGYRSIEQLEQSFADCWHENDEARLLLSILFPRRPSDVLAIV